MKKKVFFYLIFALFLSLKIFCENGTELSLKIENLLHQHKFNMERQELSKTGPDVFPFNITLFFPASKEFSDKTEKSAAQEQRNHVIIAFTQEEAEENFDKIKNFILKIQNSSHQCDITILFSASDLVSLKGNEKFHGTNIFTKFLDNKDNSVALVIDFNESDSIIISPGSSGDSSPRWLVKNIYDALSSSGDNLFIQDSSMSLYRLKILTPDLRMQSFMGNYFSDESLPSILLDLNKKNLEKNFDSIVSFIENYNVSDTTKWDRHYTFFASQFFSWLSRFSWIPFDSGFFWLSENFYVVLFTVISAFSLFVLITFSFVGKKSLRRQTETIRTLYLIPLIISGSFAGLILAQKMFPLLNIVNITSKLFLCIAQWGFKVLVSGIFISNFAVFYVQYFKKRSSQVYGFLVLPISVLNIFIFSAIDLSFMFYFVYEYIILYFSQKEKKFWRLLISLVLMTLPFFPFAYNLIKYATVEKISELVSCTPLLNLVFALALFPFQVMFIRALNSLNIFHSKKELPFRKKFYRSIFVSAIVTVFFTGFIALTPLYAKKIFPNLNKSVIEEKFVEATEKNLSVSVTSKKSLGMDNETIKINSKQKALRYELTLSGDKTIPVYDCDYDYTISESSHSANIIIPDQIENKISITLISNGPFTVSLKAYYETEIPGTYSVETFKSTYDKRKKI